jgi:hypothetical protein
VHGGGSSILKSFIFGWTVIPVQSFVRKEASVSLVTRPWAPRGIRTGVMTRTASPLANLLFVADATIPIAISTGMMYHRL